MALKYTPGRRTFRQRARAFLHFKHMHELLWEFIEFVLIATVFVLMFFHQDLSHAVSIVSHVLAALLLLSKFVCLGALKVAVKYGDPYGVDG
jgi:hypothetical protein